MKYLQNQISWNDIKETDVISIMHNVGAEDNNHCPIYEQNYMTFDAFCKAIIEKMTKDGVIPMQGD